MSALPNFRVHQLRIDNQSEPDRDDRVAERTELLIDARIDDAVRIAAEIDEIVGTSDHNTDGNTEIAADMALVLDSSDVAFEAHAVAFFRKLRARVRESMRRDAETDAEAEIAREDRANAEMVGWYARGAA